MRQNARIGGVEPAASPSHSSPDDPEPDDPEVRAAIAWDDQIEKDMASGRFDDLTREVLGEETRAIVIKACAASDEVVEQANALCDRLDARERSR